MAGSPPVQPHLPLFDPPLAPAPAKPQQLALDLPVAPDFSEASFHPAACNFAARAMLDLWPNWPDPTVLLTGPPGAGKTHLLHVWARRAGAQVIALPDWPSFDPAAGLRGPLALDDCDRMALAAPAKLFHLLNLARENGASLLLAARRRPEAWGLAMPDLVSRLRLATGSVLEAPGDDLMRHVMGKLFRDRQLAVEQEIVDYIALRLPRSLAAAQELAASLDAEALARGGKITRALAAAALESAERRGDWD